MGTIFIVACKSDTALLTPGDILTTWGNRGWEDGRGRRGGRGKDGREGGGSKDGKER